MAIFNADTDDWAMTQMVRYWVHDFIDRMWGSSHFFVAICSIRNQQPYDGWHPYIVVYNHLCIYIYTCLYIIINRYILYIYRYILYIYVYTIHIYISYIYIYIIYKYLYIYIHICFAGAIPTLSWFLVTSHNACGHSTVRTATGQRCNRQQRLAGNSL